MATPAPLLLTNNQADSASGSTDTRTGLPYPNKTLSGSSTPTAFQDVVKAWDGIYLLLEGMCIAGKVVPRSAGGLFVEVFKAPRYRVASGTYAYAGANNVA